MRVFAQTNIQLFNQLRQLGYSAGEVTLVHQGYTLAMLIFTGQYRPSGKPFICHLVGTSSILAAVGAPEAAVIAGLLHAAYTVGEFGSGYADTSVAKRRRVRSAIGEEGEGLVAEYARFPWTRSAVLGLLEEDFEQFTPVRRQVLLLRLANELEEHLDLGIAYCSNADTRQAAIESHLGGLVEVANKLKQPDLAAMLSEAFRECVAARHMQWPTVGHSRSFCLAPLSHRLRLGAGINGFLEKRGHLLLRASFGWRRGGAVERKLKEAIDRWTVQPG